MNDLIHLDQISSGCDCNKPKQSCGCKTTKSCGCGGSQQGHQTVDLSNQYFKVPNLFGELKSEWQRAEARSNLGITDILNFEQTVISDYSEGPNVWTMTASKGGNKILYNFVVKNGAKGESATIEIVDVQSLSPGSKPVCTQIGTESHAKYILGIPAGQNGEKGEQGESAFAIANRIRRQQGLDPFETEEEWLASLRGAKGDDGVSLTKVQLIAYEKAATVSYPTAFGDRAITADIFIWRYTWSDGRYTDVWVPYGGGQQASSESKTVFLYKKHTFDANPDSSTLSNYLSTLYSRVNIDDTTGKTEETLITTEGFVRYAPIIENSGRDFIYLASAVVTNGVTSRWSVVQLTGAQGKPGDPGSPGSPGSPGTSGQGLTGPVIRLRGNWVEGECYVNQSAQPQNGDELRFIDIVYYIDSANPSKTGYYQVRPTNDTCVYARPTDTTKWIKSNDFDFLFVDTLVANYLSAHYVDADEVRIHDRGTGTDKIVAGMTSGKSIGNEHNDAENVRIWAGTTVDILDQSQKGQNGKWNLNVQNAPFKVTQSGHLYASKADVEGTLQANILRLGQDSFSICEQADKVNSVGRKLSDSTTLILPELVPGKVQMFYLLTNLVSNNITIQRSGDDTIVDMNGNTSTSFTTTPNKLYQLFGIDDKWYIVEQNVSEVANVQPEISVPSMMYDTTWTIAPDLTIEESAPNSSSGRLKLQGTVTFSFQNKLNYTVTVRVPALNIYLHITDSSSPAFNGGYTVEFQQASFTVAANSTVSQTIQYINKANSISSGSNLLQPIELDIEDIAGVVTPASLTSVTCEDVVADSDTFTVSNNVASISKSLLTVTRLI